MGYPINRYQVSDSASVSYDTGRSLSAALWVGGLHDRFVSSDPTFGVRLFDDFTSPRASSSGETTDGWAVEVGAGGGSNDAFLSGTSPDGEAILSATVGGADDGACAVYAQATSGSLVSTGNNPFVLSSHASTPRGTLVYEARVDLTDVENFFCGLTEAALTFLTSAGALSATNDYIGFYRGPVGAADDVTFVIANGGTGGTADSITIPSGLVQAGYNKFGFSVDKNQHIAVTVNGVGIDAATIQTLSTTALPNENLTALFEVSAGDATSGTLDLPVDWIAVFQEAA